MPQIDDLVKIIKKDSTNLHNQIEIEVLDNGDIKVDTGGFDAVVHASADLLLNKTASLLGTKTRKTAKKNRRHHHSTHIHQHTHA